MVKLEALNLQLCRNKKTPLVYLLKCHAYYVTWGVLLFFFSCNWIALLTDQWLTFYKIRMNCLNGQHLLSSVINKKKENMKSTVWKCTAESILHSIYEKNMEIKIWVCWCQNKLVCVIALLVVIYAFFLLLRFDIVKISICIVSFLSVLKTLLFLPLFNILWSRFGVTQFVTLWQEKLIWVEILQLHVNFETVMVSCLRFWWITNSSDLKSVWGFLKEFFKFEI